MTRFAKLLPLVGLVFAASATVLRADPFTFTASASNPSGGDGPVDASATITTGMNSLDISLTNLESGVGAAGQEISGIMVTLSNGITGYSQTSITSGEFSGNLIDIASDGSYTSDPGPIAQWGTSASGSTVCLEAAGDCADGSKPTDLIIGPAPYTGVNSSITGRNPQIQGTGTFDLTVNGITSATTVDSVTFYFGTGPDFHLPGSPVAVTPEPSSLILLGTGVLGSAFLLRRRMKTALARS